jgi:hypothetical protein
LAIATLWEMWRDRFRFDVGRSFTSDVEIGNDVFIRNLAAHPVILSYWELLYVSGRSPFRKFPILEDPGPDASDVLIGAHSSITFRFADGDYFSWSAKALKGRRIYIRLHIAGRRPIFKKVYNKQ